MDEDYKKALKRAENFKNVLNKLGEVFKNALEEGKAIKSEDYLNGAEKLVEEDQTTLDRGKDIELGSHLYMISK